MCRNDISGVDLRKLIMESCNCWLLEGCCSWNVSIGRRGIYVGMWFIVRKGVEWSVFLSFFFEFLILILWL